MIRKGCKRYGVCNGDIITFEIGEILHIYGKDPKVREYTRSNSKFKHQCDEDILENLTFKTHKEAILFAIKEKEDYKKDIEKELDDLKQLLKTSR